MDEIVDVIRREGESIAVVLLPGVYYITGQVFDMKRITKVAHEHGCMVSLWKHMPCLALSKHMLCQHLPCFKWKEGKVCCVVNSFVHRSAKFAF